MAKRRSDVGHLSKEEYEALDPGEPRVEEMNESGAAGGENRRASKAVLSGA